MNLLDYINYYKEYSFLEYKFNELDALLFSSIAYCPLNFIKNNTSMEEFSNMLNEVDISKIKGNSGKKCIDTVKLICNSNRYKDIKIFNYKKIVDDNTQFLGITLRCKYFTFIGFEGSNSSTIGWIENFMISVKYPTISQSMAQDYLKESINIFDKNIYVGGHSKGGNLALTSIMSINNSILKRIKKVYNFDGPGVRINEFNSNEYKNIINKCNNYLPLSSYVGILLNNQNYIYIESNDVNQHNIWTWNIFGTFIKRGEDLSKASKNLKRDLDKKVGNINDEDAIKLIDYLKDYLIKNHIEYVSDIKYDNMIKLIQEYKGIDIKMKNDFIELVKLFLGPRIK